jgi:predicted dehydrogenase
MTKMNIGIIGIGGAGRGHASRFLKHESVDKVIGYDIKPIQFDLIPILYDFKEFIKQVDAISICTPDHHHLEYIIKGFEYAKHVLVEKPMVASLEEAYTLEKHLKNGKDADLVFAIHHQMRFVNIFQEAKNLIESNFFGDIFYIEANYWHDMRTRSTLYDDWRMKGKGQSVIFGAACHPYDLIFYLLDDYPVSQNTVLNKNAFKEYPAQYTAATTIMQFKSGITAKCHTNNCCVFPQLNNLMILGDKASFIDGMIYKSGEFSLPDYKSYNDIRGKVKNIFYRFLDKSLKIFGRELRSYPLSMYNHEQACEVIINNFINAIKKKEQVLVNFEDGIRVIQFCESAEENVKGKQPKNSLV